MRHCGNTMTDREPRPSSPHESLWRDDRPLRAQPTRMLPGSALRDNASRSTLRKELHWGDDSSDELRQTHAQYRIEDRPSMQRMILGSRDVRYAQDNVSSVGHNFTVRVLDPLDPANLRRRAPVYGLDRPMIVTAPSLKVNQVPDLPVTEQPVTAGVEMLPSKIWTEEESKRFIHLRTTTTLSYAELQSHFPGRTESGLKHRWYMISRYGTIKSNRRKPAEITGELIICNNGEMPRQDWSHIPDIKERRRAIQRDFRTRQSRSDSTWPLSTC